MEKRVIDDSKYSLDNVERTINARLYYVDGFIDKLLYMVDNHILIERKLENLGNVLESEYIIPSCILYDDSIKTNNLRGYRMKYYSDYKDLDSIVEDKEVSYKDRVEISKRLCEIIMELRKYGIAFWDVHTNNILIKGKDLKLCDMDSATMYDVEGKFEYRVDLSSSYRNLASTILSLLYGIDFLDIEEILKQSLDNPILFDGSKRSEMFSRIVDIDGYLFYPSEYIDLFTEDYIEGTRNLLIRKKR